MRYNIEKHEQSRNYRLFLFSLTGILLMPGLITHLLPEHIFPASRVFSIFYLTTVITGVYTVTDNKRNLTFGIGLGILTFALAILRFEVITDADWALTLNFIVSIIFFGFLFLKCLQEILGKHEVDVQMIYASICGFLILGFIASIIFNYIYNIIPGAYTVEIAEGDFFTMVYFSFVTLTTLGYGDISPVHDTSRTLALLFAIIGQLYLTVLIAILVGKYVSKPQNS